MKADKEGEGVKMGREDRSSREKKKETKTEKETETLRNRLYLGTPQCDGLV